MPQVPAINYITDAIFTIQGTTGGDDGNPVRTLAGTALTFTCDRIRVERGPKLENHAAGQDPVEFNRKGQMHQRIVIDTKLKKVVTDLLAKMSGAGEIVVFNCTAVGFNVTDAVAIVGDFHGELGAPSTSGYTLESYGSLWAITP